MFKKLDLNSRHYVLFDEEHKDIVFMKVPKQFSSIKEYYEGNGDPEEGNAAYLHNLNGFALFENNEKCWYVENKYYKEEQYWNY